MSDLTLPRALVDSRRWRSLTPAARAIFIELALADLGDGKPVELSVRDAGYACRCSGGAVNRGFQALVDAGFIAKASGRQRVVTKWRIATAA
jgi:DNA-binding transcriptional regulator YhcF (GntR family)